LTAAAYDLTKAAAVKVAVDALAVALARDAASKKIAGEVRGPGPDGYTLNYSNNRLDRGPFVDLYDLCARLSACERLPEPARAAAKGVLTPLDEFVLASFGGSDLPRFEPGKCGVYITFPDGDARVKQRNGDVRVWSMLRHYTPLPVPEFYGKLAWCADGAKAGNGQVENWFELLDVWYDDVKNDPKGFNNYAP
jgi:clostripain